METITLHVNGMTCGHCVAAVQRALTGVTGVENAEVKIGSATVRFDPGTASLEQITDAVEDEGYEIAKA